MTKLEEEKKSKASKIFDKKIGGEIGDFDPVIAVDAFLSPQNAARYLDVSVKFIYELIQSGELPSQPIGSRLKRIKKGTLDNWLTTQAMKFGR